MSTEIPLIEGESIRVSEGYREVYERLLAAGWQNPVEFKQHHGDSENAITINPGLSCHNDLAVVPGATHFFEEPRGA